MATSDTPLGGGIVLIGDGFEEGTAIDCLHALRDAGAETALVSLAAGLVTGSRGIVVQPDLSLDRAMRGDVPRFIIIAGGGRCQNSLFADPRVHRLVKATVAAGGKVAVLGGSPQCARRLLGVPLLSQGRLTVRQLAGDLLK